MDLTSGLLVLTILVFSAILHEVAHGYVADKLGDPTARLLGRLTLDPRPHIDPMMSIALPALLIISGSPVIFGAAKPVPVDPFNLKDGRKDLAIVSLAGPLTNFGLAILASLIVRAIGTTELSELFSMVVRLNLLLGIFNLLPIPPLDGSKVFAMLLPEKEANAYLSIGTIGIFILFFLLLATDFGGFIFNLLEVAENALIP
jgi:Zn-dependent protease